MPFTLFGDVGDALQAAFVTALAGQDPPVPVYRGGAQWLTSGTDQDFVLVGNDGSPFDEFAFVGTEDQEPAPQGDRKRKALGYLTCAVVSQTGDQDDMAGRRDRAEALLLLLDAPLRADPYLGGVVQFSWVQSVTAFEQQNTNGAVARYVFQFHYETDL
jgi:hypothetical protein